MGLAVPGEPCCRRLLAPAKLHASSMPQPNPWAVGMVACVNTKLSTEPAVPIAGTRTLGAGTSCCPEKDGTGRLGWALCSWLLPTPPVFAGH